MSIIKINRRENPFVQIDITCLQEKKLSWAAKGLLAYLLSKPNNWEIRMNDLVKQSTNGLHAVKSAMKELRTLGYAELRTKRSHDGKSAAGRYYVIHEVPLKDRFSDFHVSRQSENLTVRKPIDIVIKKKPSNKDKASNKREVSKVSKKASLFSDLDEWQNQLASLIIKILAIDNSDRGQVLYIYKFLQTAAEENKVNLYRRRFFAYVRYKNDHPEEKVHTKLREFVLSLKKVDWELKLNPGGRVRSYNSHEVNSAAMSNYVKRLKEKSTVE